MPEKPKSPNPEKNPPSQAKKPPRRPEGSRQEQPAPRPVFTDWAAI